MNAGYLAGILYALIDAEWGHNNGKEDEPVPFKLGETPDDSDIENGSFLFGFPALPDAEFEVIVRKR